MRQPLCFFFNYSEMYSMHTRCVLQSPVYNYQYLLQISVSHATLLVIKILTIPMK